jgi:hypothetical protein
VTHWKRGKRRKAKDAVRKVKPFVDTFSCNNTISMSAPSHWKYSELPGWLEKTYRHNARTIFDSQ